MKDPNEIYANVLKKIQVILKPLGYSKSGTTFYLRKNNNWGLINFQKSTESTIHRLKFTITVGTCSTELRKVEERDLSKKPHHSECHWSQRIGFFLPAKQDHWWWIDGNTNEDALFSELNHILSDIVLGEIDNHISDEQLEEYWRAGNSVGLSDYMRIVNLTRLMKTKNNEELQEVAKQILEYSRGKSFEKSVISHFQELGI